LKLANSVECGDRMLYRAHSCTLRTVAFTALLLGVALPGVGLQKPDTQPGRFPVKVNEKWGFIDLSGKMIIPAVYDKVMKFYEGFGAAQIGDKWGFLNPEGEMVIEARFEKVFSFSEGLAAVKIGGKWGYIDNTGKMVIEPRFAYTWGFGEGLAYVSIDEPSRYIDGYIDKTGKMVFTVDGIGSTFSEGLAAIIQSPDSPDKNFKHFYVNHWGKRAFHGNFDSVGDFSEGLAAVSKSDKTGYINPAGKLVIPFRTRGAWGAFSEGLAVVTIRRRGRAAALYIDKTGTEAIQGDFVHADPFSEGLAAVLLRVGETTARTTKIPGAVVTEIIADLKYGYIDKTGSVVIPPQFTKADQFYGGLAFVCLDSTAAFDPLELHLPCGYIDRTGKHVWEPSQ